MFVKAGPDQERKYRLIRPDGSGQTPRCLAHSNIFYTTPSTRAQCTPPPSHAFLCQIRFCRFHNVQRRRKIVVARTENHGIGPDGFWGVSPGCMATWLKSSGVKSFSGGSIRRFHARAFLVQQRKLLRPPTRRSRCGHDFHNNLTKYSGIDRRVSLSSTLYFNWRFYWRP